MNQIPKIVTLESKKLIGRAIEMSLVDNKTLELFSGFMPKSKDIKNSINTDIHEVLIYDKNYFKNFNPTQTFTKWVTIEVDNYNYIPNGMETLNLDKGLYAVFNYKGLAKDFGVLMSYIFNSWLPNSIYKLDNRPHFNLLGKKAKRNHPDSEETVWIPIQLQ